MKTAPLLSIGMIFKNEERCLERCLQSLQPLRDAIPCELVMADTGAEDGSREIAERYADEVFDFEWINDFAAARNAVMDRCTGKWYLTIDSDEWLDADVSELVTFLNSKKKADLAFVIQRNYASAELEKSEAFHDFRALRLMRMATGHRYHGAIHEAWPYHEPVEKLTHTILHHDGYFFTDPKLAKKKLQRNLVLLRQKLEKNPEELRTLNQCIESATYDADIIQYIRRGVNAVQSKRAGWETYGGCILRHAVEAARRREMPELDEWVEFAQKQFPDSIFVQIDINFAAFMAAHDAKEWEKALPYGEAYRKGVQLLRSEHPSPKAENDLGLGVIHHGNPVSERTLLIGLADVCLHVKQEKRALEILSELPGEKLSPDQVRNAAVALSQLHAESPADVSAVLTAFYDQISQKEPDKKTAAARLSAFDTIAAAAFVKSYQKEEKEHDGWRRPACTAFRCLADHCEAGRAAAIMMTDDAAEMRKWLLAVEDWQALPIEALEHALQAGVTFPLEEKPLPTEVLDGLAARLTQEKNPARQMVLALSDNAEYPSLQSLFWAQSLALAAMRSFDWSLSKNNAPVSEFACPEKEKDDAESEKPEDTPETGLAIIRRFAQIESAVLPLLYTPQALAEENAALLPPMHRWGLYCSLALNALDEGNPQEYLAILRKGLKACPGEKDMVQFLLDRFMEDACPKANPELLALAERVRAILAAYDPNDPAVAAIRESAAYKQVAWLIEPEPAGQMVQ